LTPSSLETLAFLHLKIKIVRKWGNRQKQNIFVYDLNGQLIAKKQISAESGGIGMYVVTRESK